MQLVRKYKEVFILIFLVVLITLLAYVVSERFIKHLDSKVPVMGMQDSTAPIKEPDVL